MPVVGISTARLRALLGTEIAGADPQQAQAECLPVIRTLLWQGMVLPRHDGH